MSKDRLQYHINIFRLRLSGALAWLAYKAAPNNPVIRQELRLRALTLLGRT